MNTLLFRGVMLLVFLLGVEVWCVAQERSIYTKREKGRDQVKPPHPLHRRSDRKQINPLIVKLPDPFQAWAGSFIFSDEFSQFSKDLTLKKVNCFI